MSLHALVLVADGNGDAVVRRVEILSRAGLGAIAASDGVNLRRLVAERCPDVVLLGGDLGEVTSLDVVRTLKRDPETRHVPVMFLLDPREAATRRAVVAAGVEDLVEGEPSGDVLLARLRPLVRLSVMYEEMLHRLASARDLGVRVEPADLNSVEGDQCSVFVVAEDDALLGDLRQALTKDGATLTLERDTYRAAQRLDDERFDAVIVLIDGAERRARALELCRHVRHNPRLFDLPVMVIASQDGLEDEAEGYRAGASSVLFMPVDTEALLAQRSVLVRRQRLRWRLRGPLVATLQPPIVDSLGNVYSRGFLERHLQRLVDAAESERRSLSVILFAIANLEELSQRYGTKARTLMLRQAADWISGLLRAEDVAARSGTTELCAVLPGSPEEEARSVADRVTGIIRRSEFPLTEEVAEPIQLDMASSVAGWRRGESARELLERARQRL